MKIGIFTESFLPQVNGIVTSICNSSRVLSKRHDVSIFTVGRGPKTASGCPVHRFRSMGLPTYPGYRFFLPSKSVWKRLAKVRLDIVHVRSSLPFGLIAMRFAMKRKIPIVGTFDTPITDYVHYVPLLGRTRMMKKALTSTAMKYTIWFYNRCDVVIAPSNMARKWLMQAGCKSRIVVISNGVDTKRFSRKNSNKKLKERLCPDGGMMMLHVGRISKEKSISVLVRAAKMLKDKGFGFCLVVVGRGPEMASVKRDIKRFGVQDCVKMVGFVPDKELPKYYASADVFVTASPVETEGIVMLESMASGTPVIGANAGATPEIVKNGENGFVFRPGDYRGLVKRVEVISDIRALKKLSAGALRVSGSYSIEKTAAVLEKLYKKLVKD